MRTPTWTRAQLLGIERLDDVVVGAGVEAGDQVAAALARGEQHQVHVGERQLGADAAAHLGAVHLRHHPVENGERRRGGRAQVIPRVGAVRDDGDVELPALERPRQDFRRHPVVVGYQSMHESSISQRRCQTAAATAGRGRARTPDRGVRGVATVRSRHTLEIRWADPDRRSRPFARRAPRFPWNGSCSAEATVTRLQFKRLDVRLPGIAVLAGIAGVALNLVPLPAVARLWPGRIATLPVAIFFGPWYGLLAALIGALPYMRVTPILPIAFAVEALMVGAFARRGKPTLVAGALLWVVAALSFALFPAGFGYGYLRNAVWPLALQQMLNGMIAVVVAELVAVAASAGRVIAVAESTKRRRLRAHAFHAFVLVAVLPVLLLSAVNGQLFATKQENEGAARLHEAVTALSNHIDEYLTTHTRAVQAMAGTAAEISADPPRRHQLLEQYHGIYEGFITLLVADPAGNLLESVPPQPLPQTIADRPYFSDAVRTRRLAISEIFVGRRSHVPIVTIAVPDGHRDRPSDGRRRRFARSLEVPALRRGVPHAGRRDDYDRRSAGPRHLRDGELGLRRPAESRAGRHHQGQRAARPPPAACSATTGARRRRARAAAGGRGGDRPLGLEDLRRTAAAQHAAAEHRLLRADADLDRDGARRRGAGRARVCRRRDAPARRARRHRPEHLGGGDAGAGGDDDRRSAGRDRRAARGRERHAGAARRFVSAARTGARAARAAEHRTARADRGSRSQGPRAHRGARRRHARRRRGEPGEERVPREHEPRDPHADERHHRHDRARARHDADRRAARIPDDGQELGGRAARHPQRHPRFLEDRDAQARARGDSVLGPRSSGRPAEAARAARRAERARADLPRPARRAERGGRRSGAPAPGDRQPGRQRDQVHRARADPRAGRGRVAGRRRDGAALFRQRQRHRHPEGEAAGDLRAVPAGRRIDDAPVRRHGAGPGDLVDARGADGRTHLGRKHAARRQHVPLHGPARRVRRPARS